MTLAANQEFFPTDEEVRLIRTCIRDCYTKAIGEWVARQKPKLRSKFNNFMKAIIAAEPPKSAPVPASNVAERIAKDYLQQKYHQVVHQVLEEDTGEFADTLHILSKHMSRSNVMASIPSVKDQTPKLLKAIAQEDHLFMTRHKAHHDMPEPICAGVVTRETRNEKLEVTASTRAKSCKPTQDRTAPFACFPSGESMESTSHSEFHKFNQKAAAPPAKSSVYNVLNAPTCL